MATPRPEIHYTVGDAAVALGISVAAVRRSFDRGELAGFRNYNGHRFIPESAIVAALARAV